MEEVKREARQSILRMKKRSGLAEGCLIVLAEICPPYHEVSLE